MRPVSSACRRCVAAFGLTLAALFVARPAGADDPALLGIYAPGGLYYEAQLVGDIVYMAGDDLFHVVDVSDPTQPTALAVRSMSFAVGVEIVGNRAYVSQYLEPKLEVLNIANPSAPTSLGGWVSGVLDNAYTLDVAGDLVYLVTDSGLRVLDVSGLPTVVEIGTLFTPEFLTSVAVAGDHAYLAANGAGLFIVDVSDPTLPDHVDTLAGAAEHVEVEGTHLYVGGGGQFRIFDVSIPGSPVLVGQAPIAVGAIRVDEAAGIAYGGRRVIDVSDVTQPSLIAEVSVPSALGDIVYSDGFDGILYAPHLLFGLHIFRVFPSQPSTVLPILGGLLAPALLIAGWAVIQNLRPASSIGTPRP